MQINNKEDILYAGFFVRLSAYIVDWIILGFLLLIVKIPKLILYFSNPDSVFFKSILFKFSTIDILIYLLGLAYFVIMTYFYGATLGKKLFNLKVRKSNEEKLSLVDVIYRESIGRYLSSILFLGYLIIMGDSKKRGFHDMLCDTIVVYHFNKNNNDLNYDYYDDKVNNTKTEKKSLIDDTKTNIENNSKDINNNEKSNANNVNNINKDVDN